MWQARVRDSVELINAYGLTEATVTSTLFRNDKTKRDCIPIGRPIANTTAHILDEHLQPVPIGTPGELLLADLASHEATAARPSSRRNDLYAIHSSPVPDRLYKTGDLARFLLTAIYQFLAGSTIKSS